MADDDTLHDDGPRSVTGQTRMCIVTRREQDTDDLIRFVAGPGGEIVPDIARKLPGRGVWVSLDRASVAAAVKTRAFSRGLKRAVVAPANLPEIVGEAFLQRVIATLALANKAGLAITGYEKVAETIAKGSMRVLLHGADAAEGGRQKLDGKLAAAQAGGGRSPAIVDCLSIEQMSLAMGRPNVVHAALKSGGLTERFLTEAERLQRFGASTAPAFSSAHSNFEPEA